VVLVPGMGASWNTKAILNCDLQAGGKWTLAPYAKNIYQPLIDSLEDDNWDVKTYTYDWRDKVQNNSSRLNDFINNNTNENEKINFFGHSMGGLLGYSYLENSEEGNNKIYKYLTAGTPYKGIALAYYPWSGGKLDSRDLTERIATTILLNHCRKRGETRKETLQRLIPSFQDLLPTEDYLRDWRTNQLKPVGSMHAKNEWLLNNSFNPLSSSSIIGTMSGSGYKTLGEIKVKNQNRYDKRRDIWEDGRPIRKIFSTEGDGTVLASSAEIDESETFNLNQTHSGLLTSSEGINTILNFFNDTTPLSATKTKITNSGPEPETALLVIGYPANFILTDNQGKVHKAKQNMVFIPNPKSGKFRLALLPKDSQTTFIVTQFLKNGRVLYKEYKFKNIFPKFKTINFNEKFPREDILKRIPSFFNF